MLWSIAFKSLWDHIDSQTGPVGSVKIQGCVYMEIRKATIDDVKDISRIHALSWKSAYKGIVPQTYLDELKEDFWVPVFEAWIKNAV